MDSLVDDDPPKIQTQQEIEHPTEEGTTIGEVGWEQSRNKTVFVQKRKREHAYRSTGEGNDPGYAISESILSQLRAYDVEHIYIHESETGDVYQFGFKQYTDPKEGMRLTHHPDDPQRCVPVNKCQAVYNGISEELYTR